MTNKLPPHIRKELEALGVVTLEEKPKQIKRQFEFNMPKLDENGEPDF